MEKSPEKDNNDTSNELWRSAVQQSYRNQQVRAIAKELASLEPGATEASKLRLAMQFEDAVFKTGSSLADYHKKLTKRLNKLKKNYKPPSAAVSNNANNNAGAGGGGSGGAADGDAKEREQKIKDLIGLHGDTLRYICTHANEAVQEMRLKQGDVKAKQLQQHVEAAEMWAKSLGIPNGRPNYNMSPGELERLTHNIEKRLETIRSHTVKLIEPDAFLVENIQKIEEEFRDKPAAVKLQSQAMRIKLEKIRSAVGVLDQNHYAGGAETVTQSLEAATRIVPLSLPSQDAALLHLTKMNAASHVLLAYLLADDKYGVPKQAVLRAHDVASNTSMKAVQDYMKELRAEESATAGSLQLRDVWMKRLVLSPTPPSNSSSDHHHPAAATTKGLALQSKVLLRPGRNAPTTVVSALQAKGATLVRPAPTGAGAHVLVPFVGNSTAGAVVVFTMTIYFIPLVVTLRAGSPMTTTVNNRDHVVAAAAPPPQCAAWPPLHQGGVDDWLVQERLRDASIEATQVLRQCFTNKAGKATAEFEVEVLETSALLEFIELAKQTFR